MCHLSSDPMCQGREEDTVIISIPREELRTLYWRLTSTERIEYEDDPLVLARKVITSQRETLAHVNAFIEKKLDGRVKFHS